MVGEDTAWNWGITIIGVAVGIGIGFIAAVLGSGKARRIKQLEEELAQTQNELSEYRGKVNEHFQKAAELFEDMTHQYRRVYQHLAQSAQTLCDEQPQLLRLDLPREPRRRLPDDTQEGERPPVDVPEFLMDEEDASAGPATGNARTESKT